MHADTVGQRRLPAAGHGLAKTTADGGRRELWIAVLAATVGAGLALFALSRTWVVLEESRPAPMAPLREPRTGGALLPWLPAIGLVGLAGAGALVATGRVGRIAVGGLLVLCGFGLLTGAGYVMSEGAPIGWPLGCAAGGLLLLGVGGFAIRRGRAWPGLGSRYERSAVTRPHRTAGSAAGTRAMARTDAGPTDGRTLPAPTVAGRTDAGPIEVRGTGAMWDALDRGDDPTVG